MIFAADVFEKLNELNVTMKDVVCTWNEKVFKIIENKTRSICKAIR